jgi:hypothetical protein
VWRWLVRRWRWLVRRWLVLRRRGIGRGPAAEQESGPGRGSGIRVGQRLELEHDGGFRSRAGLRDGISFGARVSRSWDGLGNRADIGDRAGLAAGVGLAA